MIRGHALFIASTGGCVPWMALRLPTPAIATATAMRTPMFRRMTGYAPAPDSHTARPSRKRKLSTMRKEGATFGRKAVNLHPAQTCGRSLHGRALRRSARFHARSASGCRTPILAVRGALMPWRKDGHVQRLLEAGNMRVLRGRHGRMPWLRPRQREGVQALPSPLPVRVRAPGNHRHGQLRHRTARHGMGDLMPGVRQVAARRGPGKPRPQMGSR